MIPCPWPMVPVSFLCHLMSPSSPHRLLCLCPIFLFVCGMLVNPSSVLFLAKLFICLRLALSQAGACTVNSQVTGLGIVSRPGVRLVPVLLSLQLLKFPFLFLSPAPCLCVLFLWFRCPKFLLLLCLSHLLLLLSPSSCPRASCHVHQCCYCVPLWFIRQCFYYVSQRFYCSCACTVFCCSCVPSSCPGASCRVHQYSYYVSPCLIRVRQCSYYVSVCLCCVH